MEFTGRKRPQTSQQSFKNSYANDYFSYDDEKCQDQTIPGTEHCNEKEDLWPT